MVFAAFLTLIFFLSLISHRVERTVVTGPMVFTVAGILLFLAQPSLATLEAKGKTVLFIAEVALALVLFTDATRIRFSDLIGSAQLPARLLGIGMPLTIASGAVAAVLLFTKLTFWEAAILAVILAPTDASLGQVVVNSRRVPARIRQALNVEAGLNDGLSIPFLMLFVALAGISEHLTARNWLAFTGAQIGLGLLVGLVFGWLGGWLVGQATRRGWTVRTFQQLALLSLALMCWFTAEHIGGNGFIAAFVGGIVVKIGFEDAGEHMIEFAEAWGLLLDLFVFLVFGVIVAPLIGQFSVQVVLYAILSLTVVRLIPVAAALIGTRLRPASVLFLGWFGPRGLASIVLGLIFLEEKVNLPGQSTIVPVVAATVLLSVFAHGITAAPGITLYAKQVEALPPDAPELQQVIEPPTARSPQAKRRADREPS